MDFLDDIRIDRLQYHEGPRAVIRVHLGTRISIGGLAAHHATRSAAKKQKQDQRNEQQPLRQLVALILAFFFLLPYNVFHNTPLRSNFFVIPHSASAAAIR